MSESENSELDIHEPAAFGQQLLLAREKAGMTIDEAARALNLKQEIVEAIEESAMDRLPPVAFVQGYVRTYARLLGLSEDKILQEFEEEVPHEMESELVPRPPSPDGANSQTPVIKLVTVLVVVLAVLVLIYALYSFYIKRTESVEQARLAADDASQQMPLEAPQEEPEAVIDEPVPQQPETVDAPAEEAPETAEFAAESPEQPSEPIEQPEAQLEPPAELVEPASEVEAEEVAEDDAAEAAREMTVDPTMPVPKPQPITGGDVLAVSAEQECWAEIVDANDIRMFYGTIVPGRDLKLTGQAPFEVFLGNAPAVTLSLNSINIDMTKYIRSNNIAQFKISIEDGRARFH